MNPPPGQSVSVAERAFSPKARGPYVGRPVAGQLLANVEPTTRRRRVRLADADDRPEDRTATLVQRRAQRAVAESRAGCAPSGTAASAPRGTQPVEPFGRIASRTLNPRLPVPVPDSVQHLDDVPVELRRAERDSRQRPRRVRGSSPRDRAVPDEGPAIRLRRGIAENEALRAHGVRSPGQRRSEQARPQTAAMKAMAASRRGVRIQEVMFSSYRPGAGSLASISDICREI